MGLRTGRAACASGLGRGRKRCNRAALTQQCINVLRLEVALDVCGMLRTMTARSYGLKCCVAIDTSQLLGGVLRSIMPARPDGFKHHITVSMLGSKRHTAVSVHLLGGTLHSMPV